MMKFRFRRQGTDTQREKIKQELFAFSKTVEHGFPHQPSALAYDPELQLMAIGTKAGAVKVYGAPGVEFTGLHNDTTAVIQIHFLPGQGRLLSLLDDNSIHLWELTATAPRQVGGAKREGAVILQEVGSYSLPGRPGIDSCSTTRVTVLLLLRSCDLLCIGTEGGGVYFLDLPSLSLKASQTLPQDQVTQSLPEDYRCGKSLGPVESLQEHPRQAGKVLIGYSRGLVVLWDVSGRQIEQLFFGKQQLESLVWECSGNLFVSSHSDGGYSVWAVASGDGNNQQPVSSTIPYGPFPCKAINKILWRTTETGSPVLLYSGGMPRASYGDRHCLTIQQDKDHITLDFTSRVIDFFTVHNVEREREFDDPSALVVLLEEELVVIDLQTPGWPTMPTPYLAPLHSSAITCSCHITSVPPKLWERLVNAGKAQQGHQHTPRSWPICGGKNLAPPPKQHELLLTGHEDGTVRFWDASGIALTPLYKLSTANVFHTDCDPCDEPRDPGDDPDVQQEEEWPPFRKVGCFDPYSDDPRLGIQKISLCKYSNTPCDIHSRPLGRGFVRVLWYPDGGKQDIGETQLLLEDRSIVIRDIVRRNNSNDNQCGIVTNVNIECAVKLLGTNCVLYPVNSKELQHIWSFMYGDYIVYDFWLGKVYDFTSHIVLKLSNGARCSMNVEDGAKLYDVSPHVCDPGLFFDEEYGFYPGQVLIGPSKVFSNVQWLSGVKPVLCRSCKFRAVVEEVKVSELNVTWITKSYSPKGSDSNYPPPCTITQENLCRVRRLGHYDHTQRQLGDRGLYVFPANGDATRITFEGPERTPVLQEDPVGRKLKRFFKKDAGKKTENVDTQGEHNLEQTDTSHHDSNCPNNQNPPDSQITRNAPAEHGEHDADDEAAEDTDDTSSLTSSASSTTSSQSGGLGPNRKKSIPLSIRNLKRKHKKKRTKFSREFKPGDSVAVEVVSTKTTADVMWKDGHVEKGIRSNDLIPIQHLDCHEFCPGDFVVDKRSQALQDPGVYGVIQSGDHKDRTCVVKWIKLNATSDDVEVIGVEQDVSVYDIADHPDFHFRTTDIVIRIWNSEVGENECENETSVGQVSRVDVSSKVEVVWPDNSMTIVLPQHLYCVESDIEEADYEEADETSSGLSTEEWEDESDSWETDNGLTTEDDSHVDNMDVTETVTPTSCYPTFIIPPREGDKVGVTSPTKSAGGKEGEASVVASSASGGAGAVNGAEKPGKDCASRGFRELKEALRILESLKNMTVEQLWTGLSPTSPTSVAPSSAANVASPAPPSAPEKPNKEKRFLDDLKKLQENLRKTLDNVAIVDEEKMEAVVEAGGGAATKAPRPAEEKPHHEPQTPVTGQEWPSDFLSDTPVLCQQSGGKPGVTFTSAKGEVFSVLDWAPETHAFQKMEFQPAEAKKFFSTVRKEMALLATSLPDGIMVKTFEDRMDLFSALIKGPNRTPYEDGLFLFDIQLPNIYPALPPLFRYLSQCSGRLNPNLYNNGKVCVSLLGTWIGKGTERWTSKSSLLQVLISIQGLILVNEPYYNEAGFDSDRGLQEGYENSRCYNEMALIKMVQSMTQLLQNPVEVFKQEIREHFVSNGWRLVHRLEMWLELHDAAERGHASHAASRAHHAKPSCVETLEEQAPVAVAHSTPRQAGGSIIEEEPEDSGLSPSTTSAFQGETGQIADRGDSSRGFPDDKGAVSVSSEPVSSGGDAASAQPVVRPKKRRKSYRSFLPEGGGYPDIGFPLFPLSKGFVKSVRCVLLQYRAALVAAAIPEHANDT